MGHVTNIDDLLKQFREVVVLDTEYIAPDGERPEPVCAVAYELKSGQRHRLWAYGQKIKDPPWADGRNVLTVVYYGLAEFGFFQSMGWTLPVNVLDLHAAFSWFSNGKQLKSGGRSKSLLGAVQAFNLNSMLAEEKEFWRDLIVQRAWSEDQIPGILNYCEKDVHGTARLLSRMAGLIDYERELFRGHYIKSLSLIEQHGIPVDKEGLDKIRAVWPRLKKRLISEANTIYPFYEEGTFKLEAFSDYLKREGVAWKRTPTGRPVTSSDYFRARALSHPDISKLREIRDTITQFKTLKLSIGKDNRNRFMQSPFRSITGRNQPSNSKNIFGGPKWMRQLIQPPPGYGMSYVDWGANEFGIAAFLSEDPLMIAAYRSPCPYLWFAMKVGHAPEEATKQSHPQTREKFKTLCLALIYGQGRNGISTRLNVLPVEADALMQLHNRTFKVFWDWSDNVVSKALLNRKMVSVFGWQYHVRSEEYDDRGVRQGPNTRSLMNWPMQTGGSEMMRAAAVNLAKENIRAVAVVHDAFLVMDKDARIQETAERARVCMEAASKSALRGNALKTEAETFIHPERFPEKRGFEVWEMVQNFLNEDHPLQATLL